MANDKFEGMAKKAESTFERGSGNADKGLDAGSTTRKAPRSADDAGKDTKENAQISIKSVAEYIDEKPVQSAFMALGIGYLLSKIV